MEKIYNFNERNYVYKRLKNSTTYLDEHGINDILDRVNEWRDLTFIFDINNNVVNVSIVDENNNNILVDDLNGNAKQFYHEKLKMVSRQDIYEYVNSILYG